MLLKNFAFCWGAFGPTLMNWPKHSVHIGKTSFFLNFCHRMFLTPTSWNYLHICHAFMLHCCCLKHLTWSTIKPHLIKGKLHKIQKVLLALTLLLWLLQILFLSRRQLDSLFSCLRHLEFHFRFEKNPPFLTGH